MERDWLVLLAGTNRPIALAYANAGASLFGILLSKYDPVTCLKYAAGLWGLPLAVALTWLTNRVSTGVLDRAKCQQTCSESPARLTQEDNKNIACLSFLTALKLAQGDGRLPQFTPADELPCYLSLLLQTNCLVAAEAPVVVAAEAPVAAAAESPVAAATEDL
ncbi:hypothetical protein SOVF_111310 [Spinacia oleracea]|nr:hypothetical protein SOVF_111310 [Spinacia oleracea]